MSTILGVLYMTETNLKYFSTHTKALLKRFKKNQIFLINTQSSKCPVDVWQLRSILRMFTLPLETAHEHRTELASKTLVRRNSQMVAEITCC